VREFRKHGSVRGALSNERPYRDPFSCWPANDDPWASILSTTYSYSIEIAITTTKRTTFTMVSHVGLLAVDSMRSIFANLQIASRYLRAIPPLMVADIADASSALPDG